MIGALFIFKLDDASRCLDGDNNHVFIDYQHPVSLKSISDLTS